jgi:hypothetical protein
MTRIDPRNFICLSGRMAVGIFMFVQTILSSVILHLNTFPSIQDRGLQSGNPDHHRPDPKV